MKRLIIFMLLTYSNILFASIAEISAIKGRAIIHRGDTKIDVKAHTKIEKKDKIQTQENTKLQIIFNDNTIISLGQKSYVKIDDYIYDKNNVKASFNVNGIFKSITGKIGHISPKNFKLHTNNATIGVRGTTIIGESRKSFDSIICSSGKIVVTSPKGSVEVAMGERTIVKKEQAPTKPVTIDRAIIQKIDNISDITSYENKNNISVKHSIYTSNEKIIDDISTIKDNWGDWNKKEEIEEKFNTDKMNNPSLKKEKPEQGIYTPDIPATDIPSTDIPSTDIPSTDIPSTDIPSTDIPNSNIPSSNIPSSSIPSSSIPSSSIPSSQFDDAQNYESFFSKFTDFFKDDTINYAGDITGNDIKEGSININVNMATSSLSGDVAIKSKSKEWQADIKDSTIEHSGEFKFKLDNGNNIQGDGKGELRNNLEEAAGTLNLTDNYDSSTVNGSFNAKKMKKTGPFL